MTNGFLAPPINLPGTALWRAVRSRRRVIATLPEVCDLEPWNHPVDILPCRGGATINSTHPGLMLKLGLWLCGYGERLICLVVFLREASVSCFMVHFFHFFDLG